MSKTYTTIVKTVNYNADAAEKGGLYIPFAQFAEPLEVETEDGRAFTKRVAPIDAQLASWVSIKDVALMAKVMGMSIADAIAEAKKMANDGQEAARKCFAGKEVIVEERASDDGKLEFVVVGLRSETATSAAALKHRSTRRSNK